MKRIMLAAATLLSLNTFAQTSKINDAAIGLRNGEMEDAKKAVNDAVIHPDTKDDPKAWFYFAAVYDTIYNNPLYGSLIDGDYEEKFLNACKKCIELDVKKRYEYYCKDQAIINSAFRSFNKGVMANQNKDYETANRYYQMVLDVLPYDKNEDLKKNNLSEKNVYLYMANAAFQGKDKQNAKIYLQKLMDLNYDDHLIYLQMVSIYLEENDTAMAFKYLDLGRQKYPSEKDLITQELNIYLVQHKQDVLLEKLNVALLLNPEDFTLQFVRGTVYDNFSNDFARKYKHDRDTCVYLKRKSTTEKVPAKKAAYTAALNKYSVSAETNLKNSKDYSAIAESDYLKVVEINPEFIDALFNLGALNNNKSSDIADKINYLPENADYERKASVLKLKRDSVLNISLGYFMQALALAELKKDDTEERRKEKKGYLIDIYSSIQQVYANLNNEPKTKEYKIKRMLIELPGEPKSLLIKYMGEPKNMAKNKAEDGSDMDVWTYEGITVSMVDGFVKSVTVSSK